MKTEEKIKKEFDSVGFFRTVKEQIARELEGKTFEQQKEIIKKLQSGEKKIVMSNN